MNNPPLILIADDDWMNRELLEAHLDSYEVISVNSGVKAVQTAQERLPDLIIVDVRMPQMDGYEVCERVRADASTRHIPILIFSALESDETQQKALEAGADDLLPKPFVSAVLMARVRSLLRTKALRDEMERREQSLWHILNRHVDENIAQRIMNDWLQTDV